MRILVSDGVFAGYPDAFKQPNGKPIRMKLIVIDDSSKSSSVKSLYKKMIANNTADLYWAPYSSGHSLTAAQVTNAPYNILEICVCKCVCFQDHGNICKYICNYTALKVVEQTISWKCPALVWNLFLVRCGSILHAARASQVPYTMENACVPFFSGARGYILYMFPIHPFNGLPIG